MSTSPDVDYRAMLSILSLERCDESPIFPSKLGVWRSILGRFQLYERAEFSDWDTIVRSLIGRGFDRHGILSRYTFGAINELVANLNDSQLALALWGASNIAYTSELQGGDLLPFR